MITSLLVPARINVLKRFFFAICLTGMMMGCASGGNPNEYRESRGEVAKFSVKQSDDFLRIIIFLKLRDGGLQRPKLYYYQMRFVLFKPRRLEEPGRLWSVTSKDLPTLYLPVSNEIDKYLFLVSKPSVKQVEKNGVSQRVVDWSKWSDSYLLEVDAKDVSQEKPIVIPPFDKLAKNADDQKELLKKLRMMFDKARVAAEKKMNTPIGSRDDYDYESPGPREN